MIAEPNLIPPHSKPLIPESQLGKSKGGLTNGGLSPKFSEKIGGKSFLENRAFSGQIGAISRLVGAFSGPIGTNSSAPHSHGGRAEIAPKGPFLARLAPFGLSPPLLSPRLDFPVARQHPGLEPACCAERSHFTVRGAEFYRWQIITHSPC